MKYKVSKGTELFKKLDDFEKEMKRCNKAAFDLVEQLGYKTMRGKYATLAGGISSIVIEGTAPPLWKKCANGSKEYFPMKRNANKELLEKIRALPIVEYDDLNKLLKYDPWKRKNADDRRISFHPGFICRKGYFLISVASYVKYKPLPGMVEILESEYEKLQTKAA